MHIKGATAICRSRLQIPRLLFTVILKVIHTTLHFQTGIIWIAWRLSTAL